MKSLRSVLWGIVLVFIGIISGLNAFEITDIDIFFDGWWTLFIIVPCFIGLFDEQNKTGNLIGLIFGILLLLSCQDSLDIDFVWKLFLPIVLIILGLSFIFKNAFKNNLSQKIKEINKNNKNQKECLAIFSSQKLDYSNEDFNGINAISVFGGVDINLINSKIKSDAVVNVISIFGGGDIFLPKDVNVKINSTSIFGGVENKTQNDDKNKVILYINATCIFGGVDIK